jgi:hypothetical protein
MKDWLESPEAQGGVEALSKATSLGGMVLVALEFGLRVARWLLEQELTRRAQAPSAWPPCPHCGSRLHSKGFQPRRMRTLVGEVS